MIREVLSFVQPELARHQVVNRGGPAEGLVPCWLTGSSCSSCLEPDHDGIDAMAEVAAQPRGWSSPASAGKTRPARRPRRSAGRRDRCAMTSRSSSKPFFTPKRDGLGMGVVDARFHRPGSRRTLWLAAPDHGLTFSISCFRGERLAGLSPSVAQTRRVGAAPETWQDTAEGLGRAGDHPLQLGITRRSRPGPPSP